MTTKITRRALLGTAGAGVVTLGSAEAAALAASSEASGSREPHYAMVFDQNKCVGFCGPLVLGLIGGGLMSFYLSALCSVAGMMCLRLFILYAGQLHGL